MGVCMYVCSSRNIDGVIMYAPACVVMLLFHVYRYMKQQHHEVIKTKISTQWFLDKEATAPKQNIGKNFNQNLLILIEAIILNWEISHSYVIEEVGYYYFIIIIYLF
jgi:hypothetical protein